MKPLLIVLSVAMLSVQAYAGTYYIDFAAGADTNAGTSTGAPWKRAPGMNGCASVCASTTPDGGDRFIFKGGVTWDYTCFGWLINHSGTFGHIIYYGVDQTWYTGGSWTRPKFDAEYRVTQPEVWPGNNSVIAAWASYITIDNFEVTGLMAKYNFGPGLISIGASEQTIIENCYLHGWDLIGTITTDDAHGGVIGNNATGPNTVANCVIENSYKTGSGRQQGLGLRGVANVYGNTFHDLSGSMLGVGGGTIHDNILYNIGYAPAGDHSGNFSFDGAYHVNLMYVNTSAVVYNNLFYDSNMPTNYYLEACDSGGVSGTIYFYNNVGIIRSTGGASIVNIDTEGASADGCGTWYVWNNTLQRDDGEGGSFIIITQHPRKPGNVYIQNNHIIGNPVNPVPNCTEVTGTCTIDKQVVQTNTVANGQGYVFENYYAPTAISGAAAAAGTNLTSFCTGSLAPLCYDRLGTPRSSVGAWDVGAYQYAAPPAGYQFRTEGTVRVQGRVQ